jgi:uncharacterized protein (DUF2141 family)
VYVYVAGTTFSTDFPETNKGAQPSYGGGEDAFVSYFSSDLRSILLSTYLGGSGQDGATSIAVDSAGNIYVAGSTTSTNFPGTTGGAQPSLAGVEDAFISRLNPDLTSVVQSTYLGGSGSDIAYSIDMDSADNVYLAGITYSTDFPGTAGGAQPSPGGTNDAFVAKFDSSLTAGTLVPTLTVLKSGTGSGTVTSSPAGIDCGSDCSEAYNQGTGVTLSATASAGSTFTGWSGACSGTGNCAVTMDSNKTVTAMFNSQSTVQYTLAVTKPGTGSGTVTSSPAGIDCGSDCSEPYNQGTAVTLSASPAPGSTFAGWSGSCSGTGNCTVSMDSNKTATATFNLLPQQQYTLALSKLGTGSGTVTSSPGGINCGSDCSEAYNQGTGVTLSATPAAGSTFAGWRGACAGDGGWPLYGRNCTVTIDADKIATATFDLVSSQQYTLAVTKSGTGSGTVTSSPSGIDCGSDCSEPYNQGAAVTLSASPAPGSTFAGWSGVCSGTGNCSVTLDSNKTATATFNLLPAGQFTLAVTKSGTGSGTVASSPAGIDCGSDCSEPYNQGAAVTLSATASAGSTFAGWSGACSGTGNCSVTLGSNKTVTATFNLLPPPQYTLSVNKSGTGSGIVTSSPSGIDCGSDCSEPYNQGTAVTISATASAGSTFAGWSGACSGTGTCSVTMDSNKTVTATFGLQQPQYSLTVVKTGTGNGKVISIPAGINCGSDCAETYSKVKKVTLVARADANSVFSGWSGDGCSGTSRRCQVTVDTAITIIGSFVPKLPQMSVSPDSIDSDN